MHIEKLRCTRWLRLSIIILWLDEMHRRTYAIKHRTQNCVVEVERVKHWLLPAITFRPEQNLSRMGSKNDAVVPAAPSSGTL